MTRHLADPKVGSVTAYIKEGSQPGNYLTRFVGYEYITAQAAARRSQDVLGVIACLAGGAQLHSRASIETIGGQIDTSTLAEDTVTTIEVQRAGQQVLFEPHATVWAEEPGTINGLWKQRLRWSRGNVQVTWRFRDMWFRPWRSGHLGGVSFGLLWFCVLLLPALMLIGSACLVGLYFVDYQLAFAAVHALWLTSVITYVFITSFTLMIDPATGRRTWVEAILFPGLVNLVILAAAVVTAPMHALGLDLLGAAGYQPTPSWVHGVVLFTYVWLAACMGVAYLGKLAESLPLGWLTSRILIYLGGYGPLLCAVTFAAYLKQLTGAEARWDKTEKTGKVAASA
jgi:cellulose synthase/poly-beta-1,6-N-acetylglucosamine synthase-like glycosyltransferase